MRRLDLIGKRFGKLTVVAFSHLDEKPNVNWKCKCDCGSEVVVRGAFLNYGCVRSCGCMVGYKHGHHSHPLFSLWSLMKRRCLNPKDRQFSDYGGRGIRVCDRWMDFEKFCLDMGDRPSKRHTLGRINNDGIYEPSNCRWETPVEQSNNKRNNIRETFNGETATLPQIVRKYASNGISLSQAHTRRRHGWSIERILTQPLRKKPMINFCKAFQTNGKTFPTLEEAQAEEIRLILGETMHGPDVESFADAIVKHGPRIVDVLTTTEKSLPKARSINGGKKTRKPKAAAQAELPVGDKAA